METQTIDGVLHEKVTHPTRTVLTGPEWLASMLDGIEIGQNKIQVIRDANNLPIIGKQVLDDPVWDALRYIPSGPYQGTMVRDHLTEIPHTYWKPLE